MKPAALLILATIVLSSLIGAPRTAAARALYDTYVLAVGSSNYAISKKPEVEHTFSSIDGANHSAELVADRLSHGGARYSLVLTSSFGGYVSLADIEAALHQVTARLEQDRPQRPLIVVYFAGHGMAEGVGWNHFSIPGDFAYTGNAASLDPVDLADHTLHAGGLGDELDKLHIPYLVMLDTCSEGKPAEFDSPVLTPRATENLTGVAAAVRVLNEFRQESPVIFSAEPGDFAETVPDPTDPDPRADAIAPLARRLVLLLDPAVQAGRQISLGEVVRGLSSPTLDTVTHPGVTHAIPGPSWDGVLISPGATAGQVDHRAGDATVPNLCCRSASQTDAANALALQGSVTFQGDAGEFITGGRRLTFSPPGSRLRLEEDQDEVTLRVGGDLDGWALSFSPPKGSPVQIGSYDDVQREEFQDNGRPGLAITSATSGCNSVTGNFTVQSIHRNAAGRIDQLSGVFRQRCDDNPGWLTATVDVTARR